MSRNRHDRCERLVKSPARRDVVIPPNGLEGIVTVPQPVVGLALFAHGSGSSRFSPRNTMVAERLNERGVATLLFDLLRPDEADNRALVFDIPLLAGRLGEATDWVQTRSMLSGLSIGYFGASTGAAAALVAAARQGDQITAIVSRGGRPDLADAATLSAVTAPTLLIVGGADHQVLALNQGVLRHFACEAKLALVPNATHLFDEPGTLEQAADLAAAWFLRFMGSRGDGA